MITDDELKAAALRGLEYQVQRLFAESRWGVGELFGKIVTQTIEKQQLALEAQISLAVTKALNSPEFVTKLHTAIIDAMSKKFAGTFDGVMHAAGKRAALDKLTHDRIVDIVAGIGTESKEY